MTQSNLIAFLTFALAFSAMAEPVNSAREVQQLLAERCVECHGPEKQKGALRLDLKAAAFKGGESGERGITPGNAGESRLFQLASSEDEDERMPPKGDRLSAAQIQLVKRWIDTGAEWPDSATAGTPDARSEMKVTDADREHWSFRPLSAVEPPSPKDRDWARTPVDQFIRQAQEAKGISPAAPADPRTLVRRIYFDLIGLPPTPEELEKWTGRIGESRVGAVRELVDELLASPHYGERWARHWLDVARYADSSGMEGDADRPNAWRYRDFVIRALNEDLPYDTFVRWQLAGDELKPDHPDAIAATGFISAGVSTVLPDKQMEEEILRNRANELDDMVSTTGQALLGLTIACARCHDHKYDPLPTRDYYRLMRVFNGGDRADVPLATRAEVTKRREAMAAWKPEFDKAVKERDDWLKKTKEKDARWTDLDGQVKAVEKRKPAPLPAAFAFADFSREPRETWFFERGNFMARNEKMDLGFLTVLTDGKSAEEYWKAARDSKLRDDSTQQRRALAEWMADLDSGAGTLLARVMVNRVWQHHFGEGIARSVSDFGTRGEEPDHPELLEWLTGEFIRSGWSVKRLHRLMVNSAAYQLGSGQEFAVIDPENRLLWRRTPQRLESEILRDSMLAAAGTLNPAPYGPSFKPPIPGEALQARNVKDPYPKDAKDSAETRRRTIYMFHKRVVQYPLVQAFDAPDAQVSCGRRMNTTVAPQALALLNDPFVRLRAEELAKRLQTEAGADAEAGIRLAFRICLSREPETSELADAREFISQRATARTGRDAKLAAADAQRLALTDFCQSIFGLNEFIYVD